MKTFRPWNVEQTWLLPPSVRDFVPDDHPAHFVRDLVRESLDLSAILETYDEERGFPPYHPVMMVALLLYAYSQGVFSSRKIAKGCEERLDFMAVTAMQKPDFRTVNKFRLRHLAALSDLFVQILRLCREAGLARLGHVALDGTKVKANASKHKAMSYARMVEAEPKLAAEVKDWLEQAAREDEAEDDEHGDERGDELPSWVANKQARLEKIREAKQALEAEARAEAEERAAQQVAAEEAEERGEPAPKPSGKKRKHMADGSPSPTSQRNFTDPESKILKTSDGFVQGYNAQAAVDADAQVIVAREVINEQNDVEMLDPMLAQIKANTGRQAKEVSADAGFCSEANMKVLARRHVRGYIATGRQRHGETSSTGRLGNKPGTLTHAMRLRLSRAAHRSRYRLRKQIVEPVFGQIKSVLGFARFLLRGLGKVRAEWSLVCTAHNLRKLMAAAA
jgi:transposase